MKKAALDAIKNGHSNVTVHTYSPSIGAFYADGDFNREIADAHSKRISTRDIAPLISLRKLASVSADMAKFQAKKDLTLEQKNELSAVMAEVTMTLGLLGTPENVVPETEEVTPVEETPIEDILPLAPLELNQESVANWQDETPIGAIDLPMETNDLNTSDTLSENTSNASNETNESRPWRLGRGARR